METYKPIRYALGGDPRLLRDGSISVEAAQDRISAKFVEDREYSKRLAALRAIAPRFPVFEIRGFPARVL